ncbi:MAG: YczE/YyaS/YitT family protein [Solirubrobacteraceae bacterium]
MLAPLPPDRRARRFTQLLAGLLLFGVSAAMLVLAELGLDPWNVLHQGLSKTFGLGIGTWTIIISFVALIGWLPLPHRPGVGTLANAVMIGLVIDVVLALFHAPHAILAQIGLLAGGILGMSLATGLYIGAGLGAGPRDGLSVGIAARGHSMRVVRTSVEAAVLLVGFLLGGTVGIGTVLFAVTIGPITHLTIPALSIDAPSSRVGQRDQQVALSAAEQAARCDRT